MKKWIKTLFVLAVLGVGGYYGYQYYQSTLPVEAAVVEAPKYQQVAVRTGSLSQSVTGTGSVSISQLENVALDYAVTVKDTLVSTGERVAVGQALLNVEKDALQTTLATLQEELDTCESDMATISNKFSSANHLRMPLYGRVKEVYIEVGQYIQDVMAEKGCIALLSLDGRMMVDVKAVEGMDINGKVKVMVGRNLLDGVVRELENGVAKVSFSDAYGSVGEEIEVFLGQQSIGVGAAYIHVPYRLTTTEEGYISSVIMEINSRKWEGNRIAYLTNIPVSSEYLTLQSKRDKLATQIADAKARLVTGTVNSPIDGIVSTVAEASAMEVEANTTLASLYVGDQKEMVVSVDELDIVNVQVGQEAQIKMDAISDKTYASTVTRVSQIGTPSSGVTVYDVTLLIDSDEQLRIGMNGTATIKIKEANDVLLVPISALNTSRDGQYVWVYDENNSGVEGEPGVRAFVTTGMSDENFAEVLTGLNEGDVVLVTREASATNYGNFRMNMGGGMMMDFGGGAMPAGGAMPSGGSSGGGRGN